MNEPYMKSFKKYWIPKLKKQYFMAKIQNDEKKILALKENVFRNWYFTGNEKEEIWKEISGCVNGFIRTGERKEDNRIKNSK